MLSHSGKNRRVNIKKPFGPSATQPGSGGRNPSLDSFTVTEPSDMTHHRFIFQVEAIFPGAELPSFLKKTSSEEASLRKDLA